MGIGNDVSPCGHSSSVSGKPRFIRHVLEGRRGNGLVVSKRCDSRPSYFIIEQYSQQSELEGSKRLRGTDHGTPRVQSNDSFLLTPSAYHHHGHLYHHPAKLQGRGFANQIRDRLQTIRRPDHQDSQSESKSASALSSAIISEPCSLRGSDHSLSLHRLGITSLSSSDCHPRPMRSRCA